MPERPSRAPAAVQPTERRSDPAAIASCLAAMPRPIRQELERREAASAQPARHTALDRSAGQTGSSEPVHCASGNLAARHRPRSGIVRPTDPSIPPRAARRGAISSGLVVDALEAADLDRPRPACASRHPAPLSRYERSASRCSGSDRPACRRIAHQPARCPLWPGDRTRGRASPITPLAPPAAAWPKPDAADVPPAPDENRPPICEI
jgi:hypothetical protein